MELTLPPGRHEIIEKQDPVHEWRVARLARLGIPWPVAEASTGHVDWQQMAALVSGAAPRGSHSASCVPGQRRWPLGQRAGDPGQWRHRWPNPGATDQGFHECEARREAPR
jgi:hypothetical protein